MASNPNREVEPDRRPLVVPDGDGHGDERGLQSDPNACCNLSVCKRSTMEVLYAFVWLAVGAVGAALTVFPTQRHQIMTAREKEAVFHLVFGVVAVICPIVAFFVWRAILVFWRNPAGNEPGNGQEQKPLIAKHLQVLLGVLSVFTIGVQCASIGFDLTLYSKCTTWDSDRVIGIGSDVFSYIMLVFIVSFETIFLYYLIKFPTQLHEMRLPIVHCVTVNILIYVQVIMEEAEHLLKDSFGDDVLPTYNCSDSHKEMNDNFEYVEIIGSAVTVETVLALALVFFHIYTHIDHHPSPERDRGAHNQADNGAARPAFLSRLVGCNLALFICYLLFFLVFLAVSLTYLVHLFQLHSRQSALNTTMVAEVKSDNRHNYLVFISCDFVSLAGVAIMTCATLYIQRGAFARREAVYEAALDIRLLQIAALGIFAFETFEIIGSVAFEWPDEELQFLKWVNFIRGIANFAQVFLQAWFLSNAIGYETFKCKDAYCWLEIVALFVLGLYNLLLWIANLFGFKSAIVIYEIEIATYRQIAWSLISVACYPIAIFYRFHSMILCGSMLFAGDHLNDLRNVISEMGHKLRSKCGCCTAASHDEVSQAGVDA